MYRCLKPCVCVFEAAPGGDVVDYECADGVAVVGARDGAEPLLPRRVPDLQPATREVGDVRVDLDHAREKINTHLRTCLSLVHMKKGLGWFIRN